MLTLKTKEKFEEWFYKKYDFRFDQLPLVCQQALVVEFFDENDIYIESIREFADYGYIIHNGNYKKQIDSVSGFESRPEALSKAIEKANDIFNLNNE